MNSLLTSHNMFADNNKIICKIKMGNKHHHKGHGRVMVCMYRLLVV